MSYPIEVMQANLDFKDGRRSDKFYHLTLLVNDQHKAAVLRRFGKNGSFGDLICDQYDLQSKAKKAFEKLFREKTGKGYQVLKNDTFSALDQNALRLRIGPAVWAKLPPTLIQHLDLGVNISGRKELDPPRFAENGEFIGDAPPRVFSQTEIAEQKAREAAEAAAEAKRVYGSNPIYGRF